MWCAARSVSDSASGPYHLHRLTTRLGRSGRPIPPPHHLLFLTSPLLRPFRRAPNGTALLIHTHTEVDKTGKSRTQGACHAISAPLIPHLPRLQVDKTGKSYYGETGLFHMNVAGQVTAATAVRAHAPPCLF